MFLPNLALLIRLTWYGIRCCGNGGTVYVLCIRLLSKRNSIGYIPLSLSDSTICEIRVV